MSRLRTLLNQACVLIALLIPLDVAAQSAEETAALQLFERGKEAFKAKRFEEALPLFEKAQAVVDNVHTQYYLDRALAAVNRCAEALPFLAKVDGQLPESVEDFRLADETRCLRSAATESLGKDNCRAALPMLEKLAGRLKDADETWRAEKATYCSTRATDFPTDTATRKAAYGLYEAGLAAQSAGNLPEAATLLTKTLALSDEPVVRRVLAGVQLRTSGCLAALKTLEGIPASGSTDGDGDLRKACGAYAPRGDLTGEALAKVVDLVTSGLKAKREGRLPDAQHALDQAAKAGNAPAVEALAIDLLFDMQRCKQFAVRIAEASPAVQLALTELGDRMKECGVDPTVLGAGGGAGATSDPLAVAAQGRPVDTSKVISWSLVGTGVACLGIAGFMQLDANSLYDEASAEFEFANRVSTSPTEGANAYAAGADLEQQGNSSAEKAQIFTGLGATFVAAGVTLLFWPEGEPAKQTSQQKTTLQPWIGRETVGFVGNF